MSVKIEDRADIYGTYPGAWATKSANLSDINDKMFEEYGGQGYKFGIVIDVSKDEWEDLRKYPVYFLDEMLNEVCSYAGIENVKRWVAEHE